MDSIKAGAHRLDDGTTIYVCDCSACLHKTGGRNTQVSKATYFRHKASRPSICLPPVPFTIAPDLPSLDLPAEFSSSKRPQELREDFDDKEVRSRKKGRSDSPELAPSFEPELQPDDSSIHMNDLDGIRMDNDTIEDVVDGWSALRMCLEALIEPIPFGVDGEIDKDDFRRILLAVQKRSFWGFLGRLTTMQGEENLNFGLTSGDWEELSGAVRLSFVSDNAALGFPSSPTRREYSYSQFPNPSSSSASGFNDWYQATYNSDDNKPRLSMHW
ncbi:uncharacterized protein HD556DRAFT_1537489 [Suillus plorans]|uniref:Uncharacterized protein n=1 Tax=Suillus plorans TaxID=116603 RepID=A0A9P7DFV4_9AGAM|nr:uncharacterized protein HD556DRAFT_1537489 [Suillus plorans]KAG1791113.1 hypothetical protein HD556DRAFT_1537489 [Suillus plorans]